MSEMKAFREEMSRQIAEEVEALKAARAETLESVKALTQAQAEAQVCPLPCLYREVFYNLQVPLKRKRSEEDVDVEEEEGAARKLKRTRVVSQVLQTAGVFTVGAVATWSALAFS